MNLRQEARAANLAKWCAQAPAIIESPRKQVHARHVAGSHWSRTVDKAAARGDGATVKAIARRVLA